MLFSRDKHVPMRFPRIQQLFNLFMIFSLFISDNTLKAIKCLPPPPSETTISNIDLYNSFPFGCHPDDDLLVLFREFHSTTSVFAKTNDVIKMWRAGNGPSMQIGSRNMDLECMSICNLIFPLLSSLREPFALVGISY